MSITRYGTGSTAGGGQPRPFARAVEADGWLYVSGQVPAVDGEIIQGGIVEQTRQTLRNVVAILEEAGYAIEDVVRVGVWLEDPRDFWSFNKVFGEYFTLTPAEQPHTEMEKHDQWMVRFSKAIHRNLGQFFQAWGVPTSQPARDSIATLPTWIPPDWPKPQAANGSGDGRHR